jgi:putative membrane protein
MSDWGPRLAAVNAALNGLAFVLLCAGYAAIRKKRTETHRALMLAAFATSVLFLVSYLTRFYLTGVHRFPGEGALKTFYLWVLGSHTILAALTPILALRTLYLAAKGRFEAHRRIARVTLPIWMYVSVTGVLVYALLYHVA